MNQQTYEGKEIIYNDMGEEIKAIVVGHDFDIGISVIAKDNKNYYLLCLNGPSSPKYKRRYGSDVSKARHHKIYFEGITKEIEEGVIFSASDYLKNAGVIVRQSQKSPTAQDCSFGQ